MNITPIRPSAVLFDLDGTLVDSLEDIHDALQAALRASALPTISIAKTRGLIGRGSHHLVRGAVGEAGPVDAVRARFLAEYQRGLTRKTRPYPGVTELLDALIELGLPVGVATNKPSALAQQLLHELGLLTRVGAVAGGDEAERKPAAGVLALCLSRLGLPSSAASRAVYVGDMRVDQEAAASLGCAFFGAGWGFGAMELDTRVRLDHPSQLLPRWAGNAEAQKKNEGG